MLKYLLLTALFVMAVPGWAQDRDNRPQNPAEPRFVLDESTKRLLDRSQAVIELQADGRLQLNTNGGHQHVYMARVGADGKIETFCADSIHGAEKFLQAQSPTQVPK